MTSVSFNKLSHLFRQPVGYRSKSWMSIAKPSLLLQGKSSGRSCKRSANASGMKKNKSCPTKTKSDYVDVSTLAGSSGMLARYESKIRKLPTSCSVRSFMKYQMRICSVSWHKSLVSTERLICRPLGKCLLSRKTRFVVTWIFSLRFCSIR